MSRLNIVTSHEVSPKTPYPGAKGFWATLTSKGPNGQADYADHRYWVKALRVNNPSTDNEAATVKWQIINDSSDAEYFWGTASSVSEHRDGTHNLPTDSTFCVWVSDEDGSRARSYLSPNTKRYTFVAAGAAFLLTVVGGDFLSAGSIRSSGVVRRQFPHRLEAFWSATNPELQSLAWDVRAIIEFEGELYVGGTLKMEPGSVNASLAKWDGTDWSIVSSGVDNGVNALAIYGGKLIAAGQANAGNHIRQFNGTSWSDVGTFDLGTIHSLKVWGDNLYVGGTWTKITAAAANTWSIVYWDGAAYNAVGGGVSDDDPPSATGDVFDLCVHDDGFGEALFVCGEFDFIDAGVGPLACEDVGIWDEDGAAWFTDPDFTNGIVNGCEAFDDGSGEKLYVVGEFNKMWRWDGLAWAALDGPITGKGTGPKGWSVRKWTPASGVGELVVVGVFESVAGFAALGVAVWNASGWDDFLGGTGNFTKFGDVSTQNACRSVYIDANDKPIVGFNAQIHAHQRYVNKVCTLTPDGGWRPLGLGVSGTPTGSEESRVLDTLIRKGRIYVCGNFDRLHNTEGRTPASVVSSAVGYWYGGEWHATAGLPSEACRHFTEFDDGTNGNELYVVSTATGVYVLNEATDVWIEVGNLTTIGPPATLITFDGKLWVGAEGIGIDGVGSPLFVVSWTLAGGWVADNTGLPASPTWGRVNAFTVWNNVLYLGGGGVPPEKSVWKMAIGGASWSTVGTLGGECFGLAGRNDSDPKSGRRALFLPGTPTPATTPIYTTVAKGTIVRYRAKMDTFPRNAGWVKVDLKIGGVSQLVAPIFFNALSVGWQDGVLIASPTFAATAVLDAVVTVNGADADLGKDISVEVLHTLPAISGLVAVGTLHDPPGVGNFQFATYDGAVWANEHSTDDPAGTPQGCTYDTKKGLVVYFGTFIGMNGSGDRAYNVGTWDGTEHGYATEEHEGTMQGPVFTWRG